MLLLRPALLLVLLATLPGCASLIAGALGASGGSASAAAEVDARMAEAAIGALTSGASVRPSARSGAVADAASFGGEPSHVCVIPGEDEPQTLAASSLEGAVDTCEAMNALAPGEHCVCREAELGASLGGPVPGGPVAPR